MRAEIVWGIAFSSGGKFPGNMWVIVRVRSDDVYRLKRCVMEALMPRRFAVVSAGGME